MSEHIYDEDGKFTTETLPNGTQVISVVPIRREEIVRCKDCARYEPSTVDEDGEGDPSWCLKWEHEWVAEDGFCAWGER